MSRFGPRPELGEVDAIVRIVGPAERVAQALERMGDDELIVSANLSFATRPDRQRPRMIQMYYLDVIKTNEVTGQFQALDRNAHSAGHEHLDAIRATIKRFARFFGREPRE